LLIDLLLGLGWSPLEAFRCTFAIFGLLGLSSYVWFLWSRPAGADNAG
jgi:hypothetical protein